MDKMKLIKKAEHNIQSRPDGRTVVNLVKCHVNACDSFQMLYVTHPTRLKENLHAHDNSYEALYFLDMATYPQVRFLDITEWLYNERK